MYIAALLIRGRINLNPNVLETLNRLNLKKKNTLVLLQDNPSTRGMLRKAESYITFGTISDELAKKVVEQRGQDAKDLKSRLPNQSYKVENSHREYFGKKVRPYFALNNPKGGFERGGIKTPYVNGGVLGFRKDGMDSLVSRML